MYTNSLILLYLIKIFLILESFFYKYPFITNSYSHFISHPKITLTHRVNDVNITLSDRTIILSEEGTL